VKDSGAALPPIRSLIADDDGTHVQCHDCGYLVANWGRTFARRTACQPTTTAMSSVSTRALAPRYRAGGRCVAWPRRGICAALKSDPDTEDIKVAMITALEEDTDREWGFAARAYRYITRNHSVPKELMVECGSSSGDALHSQGKKRGRLPRPGPSLWQVAPLYSLGGHTFPSGLTMDARKARRLRPHAFTGAERLQMVGARVCGGVVGVVMLATQLQYQGTT
jgi:CheY-like chemotaxis protein